MSLPPDPTRTVDAAGFVAQLRRLKVWAGGPSFGVLARRAGLPTSTLADAVSVRRVRLPRLEVVQAFVAACGVADGEAEAWSAAWRELQAGGGVRSAPVGVLDPVVPHQLPPSVAGFVGRREVLAAVPAGLAESRVVAICGSGGIGKTALAVQCAHAVADRFPDGQLYVNLHGFDDDHPLSTVEALGRLARGLLPAGVSVPSDETDLAALYRTLTAQRRVLVVLDNAASSDDVRPLLPGGDGCAVIVTSRDALAGLVARDGARRVSLEPLAADESMDLLAALVGERVPAEPQAAAGLVERAARVPLALRLVAELAVSRPRASLRQLVAELDASDPLDELDVDGSTHTSLRAVFSWSYRRLPGEVARAFRLLGVHPGREYDVYAVAALCNCEVREARRLIAGLLRAHLLDEPTDGRYAMHDLLHLFAVELAASDDEAVAARTRILEFYLFAADDARAVLEPYDLVTFRLTRPRPDVPFPPMDDPDIATAWREGEHDNLIAAATAIDRPVLTPFGVDFSAVLAHYLIREADHRESLIVNEAALRSCRAKGLSRDEPLALANLGISYGQIGDFSQAEPILREAAQKAATVGNLYVLRRANNAIAVVLMESSRDDSARRLTLETIELARQLDDQYGIGSALINLGMLNARMGLWEESLAANLAAMDPFTAAGYPEGIGSVHENAANGYLHLGQIDEAMSGLLRALEISRKERWRNLEITSSRMLGNVLRELNRLDDAAERHEYALSLSTQAGEILEVARCLRELALDAETAGDPARASDIWSQAATAYESMGLPEAAEAHQRAAEMGTLAAEG